MKILIILTALMFLCITPLFAEYGSGGPILTMSFANLATLNQYLDSYGFDDVSSNMISWGGGGSGFLNKTTALGGILYGGMYSSFNNDNQVTFRKTVGVVTIETYLMKKDRASASVIIGFGLGAINMTMSGDYTGHFLFFNTALCGGTSFKLQFMDVAIFELFVLYMYIPSADWSVLAGDIQKPERMGMSGIEVGCGLRFGGGGDYEEE